MSFSKEEKENLSQLILSGDATNMKLAAQIIRYQGMPEDMLTEAFILIKMYSDGDDWEDAQAIIEQSNSDTLKALAGEKTYFVKEYYSEQQVSSQIRKYSIKANLDGLKIARAYYNKYRKGSAYLLEYGNESDQNQILNAIIREQSLSISRWGIKSLPAALSRFQNLKKIHIQHSELDHIPPVIFELKNLESLSFVHSEIQKIPEHIVQLKSLKHLTVSHAALRKLPAELKEMNNLVRLNISYNWFHEFPEILGDIPALTTLNLDSMHGDQMIRLHMPNNFMLKKGLYELSMQDLRFNNYPSFSTIKADVPLPLDPISAAFTAYWQTGKSLAYIFRYANSDQISAIIYRLIKDNKIIFLPKELRFFPEELYLYKNLHSITSIGNPIYRSRTNFASLLELEQLTLISASLNHVTEDILNCRQLKVLKLSSNYIRQIPERISQLSFLEELDLNKNKGHYFIEIPDSISELKKLRILRLPYRSWFPKEEKSAYVNRLRSLLPNCHIEFNNS